MPRPFEEIIDELRTDGALRDFYIHAANRTDWNAVLSQLRNGNREFRFTVDQENRAFPESFGMIDLLRQTGSPCLHILVADAEVNCHFFTEEEIELDFRPEDFRTAEKWSALCVFFREIVEAVNKSGVITHENTRDFVIEKIEF